MPFRMNEDNGWMENRIVIRLSLPQGSTETLMEIEMPIGPNETVSLEYTQEKAKGDWGEISIRKWLMAGLCVVYEELDIHGETGPELGISGPYVSIVCHGGGTLSSDRISGTVEIRSANTATISTVAATGKGNVCLSIIFSRPFLSKLLQGENWIKNHPLYGLADSDLPASEKFYQYFLELPIRRILGSLINENFSPPQKRHYFELKLKELFFTLHLQPEISCLESSVPVDIQRKLIAAKAYLLANYHISPTIKQLSRIVSLNEFKLKRFFKMSFGITIKSYVIALRMEEARDLLLGNHSVGDIAARLGYRNVSHFILVFKRTFGETPRQMMPKPNESRNALLKG